MASTRFLTLLLAGALAVPTAALAQEPKPATPAPAPKVEGKKDAAEAEGILKKCMEASDSKKPMSCDLDLTVNIMGMTMKGAGKLSMSGDGKSRNDLSMDIPMAGGKTRTLAVLDGTNFWLVQEMPPPIGKHTIKSAAAEMETLNKKMGMGMPSGGGSSQDPASQLHNMKQMYAFDTVEEIDLDGKPGYAVSGELSKTAAEKLSKDMPGAGMMAAMMKRCRILISKSDFRMMGMEMVGTGGEKFMTMMYKNINNDPKFAADTFTYVPKEGEKVETMDQFMRSMGAFMGGGGDEDEDEDEAPAKPAAKPASKPAQKPG